MVMARPMPNSGSPPRNAAWKTLQFHNG